MKLEQKHSTTEEKPSNDTANPSKISSPVVVGLRILTDTSLGKSNLLVKPAIKISLPGSRNLHGGSCGTRSPPADESCFLKSCQLCRKKLSPDKEVYMYRGDQGFCSIECRERQIVLDETRELQLSTKTMLESPRRCSTAAATSGRREIRLLIEDLRRRNQPPRRNQNQSHWAIVS